MNLEYAHFRRIDGVCLGEIALAILFAVLAFMCPIGVYCFFLASLNQRSRPTMVSGRWDAVGLLFALSGFALITVPTLAAQFYSHFAGWIVTTFWFDPASAIWLAYYLALAGACWLMMRWRASTTMIYHVDPGLFAKVLEGTLAALGIAAIRDRDRLMLKKAEAIDTTAISEFPTAMAAPTAAADRFGVLQVEAFPAMCHVTLRWNQCRANLRREIETELEKGLLLAAPDENPAAGWFLTVSGLIFGALTVVAVAFLIIVLFTRR